MRIAIRSPYSWHLLISVQRTAAETPAEAQSIMAELTNELRPLLAGRAEIVPPSKRVPKRPRTRPAPAIIAIRPPTREEPYSFIDWQGNAKTNMRRISLPESVTERAELVALLEDVSSQYMERVDTLDTVNWCLKPIDQIGRDINPTVAKPLTDEQRQIVREQEARYVAERNRLLAPYLAGKHPVVLPDLFAEFYGELSLTEQRLVRKMIKGRDGINAYSLSNYDMSKLLRDDSPLERQRQWKHISDHLLQTKWAVIGESAKSQLRNVQDGPILVRAKKSNLLPLTQMVV